MYGPFFHPQLRQNLFPPLRKYSAVGNGCHTTAYVWVLLLLYLSYPTESCLGPGFTQTIPNSQEWSQYSTTVLKPGDAAVYSSLSFACNGTLQSLTFPYAVLGSNYRYWNEYLYILVSVWRFNETGYYQVREFQDSVRVPGQAFRERRNTTSIFPQMEVLAKDTLAFRLLRPYNSGLGSVYRHVRFLFKPGPSPGAFTPIVSASFTASSGPLTGEECTNTCTFLLALSKNNVMCAVSSDVRIFTMLYIVLL